MTEDTKQFIIKVLVAGVVIVALYFLFSPYRVCMRTPFRAVGEPRVITCIDNTSW